jgi:thiamine transport system permease protein
MILIVSPIIISLGYFIILGELRYLSWVIYIVIITINCVFLIPFSILILFTKLKNIFLNFEDIKKVFRISEKNFIKIIYPLIKKDLFYLFSFSAAISFGDFTVISFFKNESFQTLPILLYKLIISYRFNEASFVAGFILFFSLLIYFIFDNFFYKDIPDNTK